MIKLSMLILGWRGCSATKAKSEDVGRQLDEVEAYLATNVSCTNELFGTPKIQEPVESGDATDAQGDALETMSTEDLEQDPEPEVSVSDEDDGSDQLKTARQETARP